MEFAFYNPETFIIMTADHETGGIKIGENGRYAYTTTVHTAADVPVFAYGYDAKVFSDVTIENIQIPKTIAKMWGTELSGYEDDLYPALDLEQKENKIANKENKTDSNFSKIIVAVTIAVIVVVIALIIFILIIKKKRKNTD